MSNSAAAQAPLYAIIRVPKSGSQSLRTWAVQAFPDAKQFRIPNTLHLDGAFGVLQRLRHTRHVLRHSISWYGSPKTLAGICEMIDRTAPPGSILTGGHFDFPTLHANFKQPVKIVSLLRDPVRRALAEYNYLRDGYSRKFSLWQLSAGALASTAGRYSFAGFVDFLMENRKVYGNIACRYLGVENPAAIRQHFADHVYHVGCVEDPQRFAAAFKKKTGRDVPLGHENRTKKITIDTVPQAERAKLEQLYEHDYSLYEYCRTAEA